MITKKKDSNKMTLQELEKTIDLAIGMLYELYNDAHSDFQRERIKEIVEKLKKIQERETINE